MTAVLYDIALKKVETSRDGSTTDEDRDEDEEKDEEKETDLRPKEWIP
jgi:hypothetical protein